MTLSVQFMTMIAMVLGGFYMGIAMDTYRRFSPYWKNNRFLVYFMEISFWLIQTFLLFYILFRVNAGELRVYVFIACLLGFSIYQVIAATFYKKLLEHAINVFTSMYQYVKRIIYILLIVPFIWMIKLFIAIVVFIFNVIISFLTLIGSLLFLPIRMIYSLLPKKIQIYFNKLAGFCSTIKNTLARWLKL